MQDQTPAPDATPEPAAPEITPYEMMGGADAIRRVVDRFYDIMDSDPAAAGIRAMLPHVDAFLPVHNVNSLLDLGKALAQQLPRQGASGRALASR